MSGRKNGRMWGKESSGLADKQNEKKMRKGNPNFEAKSIWGDGRRVYIE